MPRSGYLTNRLFGKSGIKSTFAIAAFAAFAAYFARSPSLHCPKVRFSTATTASTTYFYGALIADDDTTVIPNQKGALSHPFLYLTFSL